MRSDARKRLTDPEAYAWPESPDLRTQLDDAEGRLTRVRELVAVAEGPVFAAIRDALDGPR